MHEGHRQRMLERLKNGGKDLQDHELLEILLFYAIPRKNTNEIAHELISAFGSFGAVFKAENYKQYQCVNGVGESTATFLTSVAQCFNRIEQEEDKRSSVFSYETLFAKIKKHYQDVDEEIVEIYKLDKKNRISFVKPLTSNQTDKASFPADEISGFIAATQPHAIVIVHNHLDGSCRPSKEDDLFTKQVQSLCLMLNVKLFDHVIISPSGTYSYFLSGDLDHIREICRQRILDEGLL